MMAIMGLELKRWLRSPAFWLLLAGLTFLLAFLFLRFVEGYAEVQKANLAGTSNLTVTRAVIQPFMQQAGIVLLLLIPLLTMRLIAGERRDGSWTLLQLAAIPPWRIVAGKMLGISLLLTFIVLLIALMPLSLLAGTPIDPGHLISACIGIWLLSIAFAAAGLWCSTISHEPVSAAMLHYGLLLLLALFHFTSNMPGNLAPTLYYLTPFSHFLALTTARFNTEHLLYFLLFTSLFLGLAILRLRHERSRLSTEHSVLATVWRRAPTLLLVVAIALLAALSARYDHAVDLSRNRINSLSAAATHLVGKLEQPLTVTAVVADNPQLRRKIENALAPWLLASSNINLSFTTPEDYAVRSSTPLNQEGRLEFSYQGQTEKTTTLSDREIIRALQRLIEGRDQWLVFLEGHGEKSPFDTSSNGYSTLRHLLEKRGFHLQGINLLTLPAIPDNTAVLVVAGPQEDLLPGESALVRNYLKKGGNLLLLREPAVLENFDTLLAALAIEPLPGVVINVNDQLRKVLAIRHPAIIPVTEYAPHPVTAGLNGKLLLPIASAFKPIQGSHWQHTILFRSLPESWNEVSDLQGHVKFDAGEGEQAGPLDLAIAAERILDDHGQLTAVIGDSDFLNNEYIGFGDNAALAMQLFAWLTEPQLRNEPLALQPPDRQLALSDTALMTLAALLLLGLPLLFLLLALLQWRKQRRP
jgi:ABC-type transport system involved in multi-copper enzyme maturation permease subunit